MKNTTAIIGIIIDTITVCCVVSLYDPIYITYYLYIYSIFFSYFNYFYYYYYYYYYYFLCTIMYIMISSLSVYNIQYLVFSTNHMTSIPCMNKNMMKRAEYNKVDMHIYEMCRDVGSHSLLGLTNIQIYTLTLRIHSTHIHSHDTILNK
jgi:hypothetical protein